MIPLRDATPSKNVPVMNNILIGINVVVFLVQLAQGPHANAFVYTFGLVPGRYTLPRLAAHFSFFQQAVAWISFMFLHGGFLHLLGNMWFLYIFGDNVEDRLGPLRYLVFYLVCGLVSGISHFLLNSHSTVPTIGASGAVAGVMGAYFLLHPKSKILTLFPVFFIPLFFEIPAVFFLGFWFLLQFVNATSRSAQAGGIAWWAHVGGFLCGMLLLKLLDNMPSAGVTSRMRPMTAKKKTHRLQVARAIARPTEGDLHATLGISPYEAQVGARKLVTIPSGFQRRVYRVNVPPGIAAGQVLRLKGQGRATVDGQRGDILLRVAIQ